MEKTARIYIAAVTAAGVLSFGFAMFHAGFGDWPSFAVYLTLAMALSILKLRLPGLNGAYSFNFLVMIAALFRHSLAEALVLAATCALYQSLANTSRRPRPVQVLFNTANFWFSLTLAWLAVRVLEAFLPNAPLGARLGIAAAAYFLANTSIVSGILMFVERKPLREVIAEWYVGPFIYFAAGIVLVGVAPLSGWTPSPESCLLVLPLLWLLHFFSGLAKRTREEQASPVRDGGPALAGAARNYVYVATAAGLLLLGGALLALRPESWTRFLGYLAAVLICSAWKARLPGMEGTIGLGFVVTLSAIAALSLPEVLVLACGSGVVQTCWHAARRPMRVQVAFNAACLMAGNAAAWLLCRHILAARLDGLLVAQLTLACAVQYAVNSLMVSRIIAYLQEKPLHEVWRECYFWTFPYYLVGAAAAALGISIGRQAGWPATFLLLPMMAMLSFTYHLKLRAVRA